MDRASHALAETRYFEAAKFAARALQTAYAQRDYRTMARVCLPLQEARRQVRQLAADAALEGGVRLVRSPAEAPRPLRAGCYLIVPPMIGADARALRRTADTRKVPAFVLAREPLTRKGCWPIVGVADRGYRAYVPPPVELEWTDGRVTRDTFEGAVSVSWFEAAGEALGDAIIAGVREDLHPWWRVDDLLDGLMAAPEHEKLHQALADACRVAAEASAPEVDRRLVDDPEPYSF